MGRLSRKLKKHGALGSRKRKVKKAGPARGARIPHRPAHGSLSIPQWTELIQQYPDYTGAYVERAVLLYKTNRLDNALHDFSIALKLDPLHSKARYYRGRLFLDRKKWKEALSDLEKSLAQDPKNTDACILSAA